MLSEVEPDAIAIVARNLIENALRHGSDDLVQVTVTEDGWLHVKNDCAAVPPETLTGLSGRFVRGDHSGHGSGLGLSIVQKIAERTACTLKFTSPIAGQARGFHAAIQLGYTLPQSLRNPQ
ncbi:MAG: sensor histidine kinase [Yoonia sp.]|nr:sensor histidine kinase [Yoonia sp.]